MTNEAALRERCLELALRANPDRAVECAEEFLAFIRTSSGAQEIMSQAAKSQHRPKSGTFKVNRSYLRRQAKEAVNLFFAPASGVVSVVKGQRVRVGKDAPAAHK